MTKRPTKASVLRTARVLGEGRFGDMVEDVGLATAENNLTKASELLEWFQSDVRRLHRREKALALLAGEKWDTWPAYWSGFRRALLVWRRANQ